ncbi:MAG TPA: glycosyltransferase family 9 protein [Bdellovibrionales bacterium]|nr:glycosyltransferase family 9 protein [Bdellovibrionales bacterium]
MRILVLQLARFGDIYQTWPILKALARSHPDAEIHVLVRQRFQAALSGLAGVRVHALPTADILAPIYAAGDENAAHGNLLGFLGPLRDLNFDRIVNLSFSPVSSYLADAVAHARTATTGYTRFEDGYLRIPDDPSAYFFAQGEIGGANRFHITSIFAAVAGVDLTPEDFAGGERPRSRHALIHLGGSQRERSYPAELWARAIKDICRDHDCILIGSPGERALSETVLAAVASPRLRNLCGKTRIEELPALVGEASLLVGADSAPAQLAGLTGTPVLQITSDASNFWTTGPTAPGSRVLYEAELQEIDPARIAAEARAMLEGRPPEGPCAFRTERIGEYRLHELHFDDFSWRLIQALYTQSPYPETGERADLLAFQRLHEISGLALDQFDGRPLEARALGQIDTLLNEVGRLNPRVRPLVQWFETERMRLPPGTLEETVARSRALFTDLRLISSVYHRPANPEEGYRRARELCSELCPALREFDFGSHEDAFQSLVSTLHELAAHSTKVGGASWSERLESLHSALERRDFIEIADQLEHELLPALS